MQKKEKKWSNSINCNISKRLNWLAQLDFRLYVGFVDEKLSHFKIFPAKKDSSQITYFFFYIVFAHNMS